MSPEKLITREKENPDPVEKQWNPGFVLLLSANFIVVTAHWAAHSLKFENDADESSRTAGRQPHSHSIDAGGLVVTSSTMRLTWGTSLTIRAETRAIRS